MNLTEKINILSRLGKIMESLSKDEPWSGYELGINQSEYEALQALVEKVHIYNGWFTPEAVKESLGGIASWLTESSLQNWLANYKVEEGKPKTVALIMAGNIPLVGFHDFISVFLSGNKALIKLSSDDKQLFPAFLKTMHLFNPEIDKWVKLAEGPMKDFDAVIATGSDNSAQYFESYFGKHPNIIRKNRTSVAVLTGEETDEELKALGRDIFTYFGLGCRNVSHMRIPKNFELDRFFKGIYEFNPIIHHNKYANNYDYNKAVYLLNQENLLDNGFILLKEDQSIHSPLGMLFFSRYERKEELDKFLEINKDKIQAVIGRNYIPFGQAQQPGLCDYADGVDTMEFLTRL